MLLLRPRCVFSFKSRSSAASHLTMHADEDELDTIGILPNSSSSHRPSMTQSRQPPPPLQLQLQHSQSSSKQPSKRVHKAVLPGAIRRTDMISPRQTNKVGDDSGGGAVSTPSFTRTSSNQSPAHANSPFSNNKFDYPPPEYSPSSKQATSRNQNGSMNSPSVQELTGSKSGRPSISSLKRPSVMNSNQRTLQPSPAQQNEQQRRKSTLQIPGSGGTGSAKTKPSLSKDYVASRVWKNESTLTFGMRVKLAEQPEYWADAHFATTNIIDVWEHYDTNKDDILNKNEIPQLANDLVDRFVALYKAQLLIEQPTLPPAQLDKMVKKDCFPHLLPGENIVESKRIMCDRLWRELDVDGDGTISKTEFLFQWKNTSKQYLTFRAPKSGGLACLIL